MRDGPSETARTFLGGRGRWWRRPAVVSAGRRYRRRKRRRSRHRRRLVAPAVTFLMGRRVLVSRRLVRWLALAIVLRRGGCLRLERGLGLIPGRRRVAMLVRRLGLFDRGRRQVRFLLHEGARAPSRRSSSYVPSTLGNCRRGVTPVRDCTRSRAPARIASASGAGKRAAPAAIGLLCRARIAPSNVMPRLLSTCAAALLPSPTIAASTMAPLISRRRPPRAAAAAASRMRRISDATTRSMSGICERVGKLASCALTSATSSATLTLLAASTSTAS